MRRLVHILVLVAAVPSVVACAGTGSYTVSASLASPDLLYVSPGVYAVANADAPVFYSNDYYWLYSNGLWYRSNYLSGGWQYAPAPYVIRQIRQPLVYHRYQRYPAYQRVHVGIRERVYPRIYPGDRDQRTHRIDLDRDRRDRTRRIEIERRGYPQGQRIERSHVRTVNRHRAPAPAPNVRVRERTPSR
jgi:hypothetical protein